MGQGLRSIASRIEQQQHSWSCDRTRTDQQNQIGPHTPRGSVASVEDNSWEVGFADKFFPVLDFGGFAVYQALRGCA